MSYCWYATYGSNLLAERLYCYLQGGVPPLGSKAESGARDASLPTADRAIFLQHQLFFAHQSKRWSGAGICFLDPQRSKSAQTCSRIWRVTTEQFVDIVRQENNDQTIDFDCAEVAAAGGARVGKGLYGRFLVLDEIDGEPVMTCTGQKGVDGMRPNPPHADYLTVVAAGLHQTVGFNRQALRSYFDKIPGIRGSWEGKRLNRVFDEAINMARYLTASGEIEADLAAGYSIDEDVDPESDQPDASTN